MLLILALSWAQVEQQTSLPTTRNLPRRIGIAGIEASVPVIDLAPLFEVSVDGQRKVGSTIIAAAKQGAAGFFTITNHGISMSQVEQTAAAFFKWPLAEKMKLAPRMYNSNSTHLFRGYSPPTANGKELLDSSNPAFRINPGTGDAEKDFLEEPSRCPPERPELCEAIDAYWHSMQGLGTRLLGAIAAGLGENDTQYFARAIGIGHPMSCLRFNRYPVFSPEELATSSSNSHAEGLACESHRDMSILTILNQGSEGGLQIYQKGAWRDVPLTPGAFVVNIGGALQRWTNDALVATEHRVRMVDAERISIPFFLEGSFDTPITCVPATVSLEKPCKYPQTTYGPYIKSTFRLFQEYSNRDLV